MSWRIEELELAVDDPASERWLEVHLAANRAVWGAGAERTTVAEVLDAPARRHEVRRAFGLWVDDGQGPDGLAAAAQTIRSTRDNLDTAGLWLSVHPSHQRRGLGSALLSHCEASLRADGCTRIHEHSGAPVESGDAATGFAIARAYRQTLVDLRQDLAAAGGGGRARPAGARPRPRGIRPGDRGRRAAGGVARGPSDARPTDEHRRFRPATSTSTRRTGTRSGWPRVWNTPGEVRSIESVREARPVGPARGLHRPRGSEAGLAGPRHAGRHLVLREHRGNALGLALKVANLRALAREQPGSDVGAHVERRDQRPDARRQRPARFHGHRVDPRVGARASEPASQPGRPARSRAPPRPSPCRHSRGRWGGTGRRRAARARTAVPPRACLPGRAVRRPRARGAGWSTARGLPPGVREVGDDRGQAGAGRASARTARPDRPGASPRRCRCCR